MTTVINSPGGGDSMDSGAGIIIGVIVAIILVALFIIYGLPAIRNQGGDTTKPGTTINVSVPAGSPSSTTY